MTDVVLACSDLMTTSRFAAVGVRVRRCSTAERVALAIAEAPDAMVLVDLTAFAELMPRLRADFGARGRIVAFAPHVQVDLLDGARPWADEVLPRGSAMKRFSRLTGVQSAAETEKP